MFYNRRKAQYIQEMKKYNCDKEEQRKYVAKFFEEQEIKAHIFRVSGNGFVNKPFRDSGIKDIRLYIEATAADLEKFGKQLKVPDKHSELRGFKCNSKILNLFASGCVENKIIINLHKPSLRDYFKSLKYAKIRFLYFEYKDKHYLLVDSELLKVDDIPEGFSVIKTSEFYKAKEEWL